MAREVRIQQWTEIMRERQASGMTITAWCKDNGIDRQRYFYWQRRLREMACEQLAQQEGQAYVSLDYTTEFVEVKPRGRLRAFPAETHNMASDMVRSMVPVERDMDGVAGSSELSAHHGQSIAPAMVLHLSCGRVEILHGADCETVEATLSVLLKIC